MPHVSDNEIRGHTHGDFTLNSKVAQGLKNAYKWGPTELSAAHQESLDLICTKIARIVCGDPNHADHWEDIIGYARLAKDRCK